MRIQGIDLDISPFTLKEWIELNDTLQDALNRLFSEPRDFSHQVPVGFKPSQEQPGWGIPIKKDIHFILKILDRVRFQHSMTITEARDLLSSQGIATISTQSVQYMLDRIESFMGILPPLPKTTKDKARDNRQVLEFQRKRRVHIRETLKLRETRKAKRLLEKQIQAKQNEIRKDAKRAKLTVKEMTVPKDPKVLEDSVAQLKKESAESNYEVVEGIEKANILFEPTPKQAEFLAAPEKVVFYGGYFKVPRCASLHREV